MARGLGGRDRRRTRRGAVGIRADQVLAPGDPEFERIDLARQSLRLFEVDRQPVRLRGPGEPLCHADGVGGGHGVGIAARFQQQVGLLQGDPARPGRFH